MIELRDLTVAYGDTLGVDGVTLTLPAGKIYGLLGRNGSGKTSLLSAVASYRKPSSGAVLIDGERAFENSAVTRRVCYVRDTLDVSDAERVHRVLCFGKWLRPGWDGDYAARLVEKFGLDPRKRVSGLSRGQRSTLAAVVGLASRAPVTAFDEVHLGMDAAARALFYRELLDDYLAHPRTILLSTHLIEEAAALFEQVIILDRGRVLLHEDADELRGRGVVVTGPADTVAAFTAGRTVLAEQALGGVRAATVYGRPDEHDLARGAAAGLTFGPVGLQDLFVHLTADAQHPQEATR